MTTELIASDKPADISAPIVIDLGKKSRKRVKKLRKGRSGSLLNKVTEVLEQLKEAGALTTAAQPVVVIVRERSRKSRSSKVWGFG